MRAGPTSGHLSPHPTCAEGAPETHCTVVSEEPPTAPSPPNLCSPTVGPGLERQVWLAAHYTSCRGDPAVTRQAVPTLMAFPLQRRDRPCRADSAALPTLRPRPGDPASENGHTVFVRINEAEHVGNFCQGLCETPLPFPSPWFPGRVGPGTRFSTNDYK